MGSIHRFTYALRDNNRLRIIVSRCCIVSDPASIHNYDFVIRGNIKSQLQSGSKQYSNLRHCHPARDLLVLTSRSQCHRSF
jgi:hypothetical protein